MPAGGGVVFMPEGRYRITKTIYIWPSVRLIGFGQARPVILLGANTPGFQDANQAHRRLGDADGAEPRASGNINVLRSFAPNTHEDRYFRRGSQ